MRQNPTTPDDRSRLLVLPPALSHNLGKGRFVPRAAPALRWSKHARRALWLGLPTMLCVALTILFAPHRFGSFYYATFDPPRSSFFLTLVLSALLPAALIAFLPTLVIYLNLRHAHAWTVAHAKARRRLSHCCLNCRYPRTRSLEGTATRLPCPECGEPLPNRLAYRRARFPVWAELLRVSPQLNAETRKRLTSEERRECLRRGRLFGLPWYVLSMALTLCTIAACVLIGLVTIGMFGGGKTIASASALVGLPIGLLTGIGPILLPTLERFAAMRLLSQVPTLPTDHPHRCQHCHYSLVGNTTGLCPECGAAIPHASSHIPPPPPPPSTTTDAAHRE